jgi:hypothetical protein
MNRTVGRSEHLCNDYEFVPDRVGFGVYLFVRFVTLFPIRLSVEFLVVIELSSGEFCLYFK